MATPTLSTSVSCVSDSAVMRIPYYRTKLDAEKVVLEYADRGLDAVIVNPTYLIGPWDIKPTSGRMPHPRPPAV